MTSFKDLIPSNLTCGTLQISPQPNRFAFLKIPDQVVKELFKKFKERIHDDNIQLPPYFESSEKYPNPVGAHVTIVNSGIFGFISTADALFDFENSVFPFECKNIEEKTPKHWKEMAKVWICTIKSRALDRINKILCRDLDEGESFHFTFAVKRREEIESIEPISRSLPQVAKSAKRALSPSCDREDYLMGMFEDKTANDITLEHIESAHKKGYNSLVDMLIQICKYEKIERSNDFVIFEKGKPVLFLKKEKKDLAEKIEADASSSFRSSIQKFNDDAMLKMPENLDENFVSADLITAAHNEGCDWHVNTLIRIGGYRRIDYLSCSVIVNKASETVCVLEKRIEKDKVAQKDSNFRLSKSEQEEDFIRRRLTEGEVLVDRSFMPFADVNYFGPLDSDSCVPLSYVKRFQVDLMVHSGHTAMRSDSVMFSLLSEPSELYAANSLRDVEGKKIRPEHIKKANELGYYHVASMLKRKMEEAAPFQDRFGYDDISRLIADAADEEEAISVLFDDDEDPLFNFKWSHMDFALDRGYEILADMINLAKETEIEFAEEDVDDFIPSEWDDVEVSLRNRKIKQEDLATSIIRNHYDDAKLMRKVKRLSHDKFHVSHVVLARQQDLRLVEKHIRSLLN